MNDTLEVVYGPPPEDIECLLVETDPSELELLVEK